MYPHQRPSYPPQAHLGQANMNPVQRQAYMNPGQQSHPQPDNRQAHPSQGFMNPVQRQAYMNPGQQAHPPHNHGQAHSGQGSMNSGQQAHPQYNDRQVHPGQVSMNPVQYQAYMNPGQQPPAQYRQIQHANQMYQPASAVTGIRGLLGGHLGLQQYPNEPLVPGGGQCEVDLRRYIDPDHPPAQRSPPRASRPFPVPSPFPYGTQSQPQPLQHIQVHQGQLRGQPSQYVGGQYPPSNTVFPQPSPRVAGGQYPRPNTVHSQTPSRATPAQYPAAPYGHHAPVSSQNGGPPHFQVSRPVYAQGPSRNAAPQYPTAPYRHPAAPQHASSPYAGPPHHQEERLRLPSQGLAAAAQTAPRSSNQGNSVNLQASQASDRADPSQNSAKPPPQARSASGTPAIQAEPSSSTTAPAAINTAALPPPTHAVAAPTPAIQHPPPPASSAAASSPSPEGSSPAAPTPTPLPKPLKRKRTEAAPKVAKHKTPAQKEAAEARAKKEARRNYAVEPTAAIQAVVRHQTGGYAYGWELETPAALPSKRKRPSPEGTNAASSASPVVNAEGPSKSSISPITGLSQPSSSSSPVVDLTADEGDGQMPPPRKRQRLPPSKELFYKPLAQPDTSEEDAKREAEKTQRAEEAAAMRKRDEEAKEAAKKEKEELAIKKKQAQRERDNEKQRERRAEARREKERLAREEEEREEERKREALERELEEELLGELGAGNEDEDEDDGGGDLIIDHGDGVEVVYEANRPDLEADLNAFFADNDDPEDQVGGDAPAARNGPTAQAYESEESEEE